MRWWNFTLIKCIITEEIKCKKSTDCPYHLTCLRMSSLSPGCGNPCIFKDCEKGERCSVTNHVPFCYKPKNNTAMSRSDVPHSTRTPDSESSPTTSSGKFIFQKGFVVHVSCSKNNNFYEKIAEIRSV